MPVNGKTPPRPPTNGALDCGDAHGRAALVLAESLVHGLCENMIISTGDAVDIVDRAASVQHERAAVAGFGAASLLQSHGLLVAIANSFRADLPKPPIAPGSVS